MVLSNQPMKLGLWFLITNIFTLFASGEKSSQIKIEQHLRSIEDSTLLVALSHYSGATTLQHFANRTVLRWQAKEETGYDNRRAHPNDPT